MVAIISVLPLRVSKSRSLSVSIPGSYRRKSNCSTTTTVPEIENDTVLDEPTKGLSWFDCVLQIFFSVQGPTMFVLPVGFRYMGYVPAVVASVAVISFYMHTCSVYLWCFDKMQIRYNADDSISSIESLIDMVFGENKSSQKWSAFLKSYYKYEVIVSWGLTLALNQLFVCQNARLVLNYYGYDLTDNILLAIAFPISTLFCLVPNLNAMSKMAFLSTACLIAILLEIVYFSIIDPRPSPVVEAVHYDLSYLPTFIATVLLTCTFTPLIFPLRDAMINKQSLGSTFGSMNVSLVLLMVVNIYLSFTVYLSYGDETRSNVMQNLPQNTFVISSLLILSVTLLACSSITFYVVFQTIWCDKLQDLVDNSEHPILYEVFLRVLVNLLITVVAMVVPTLEIFINLTSSFSCPYDSILLPIVLQFFIVKSSDERSGLYFAFISAKTCICSMLAVAFFLTTFCTFLYQILDYYRN